MSIEFGLLHNLIRTYQRSLHLNESAKPAASSHHAEPDDRVSISGEARDEHRHLNVNVAGSSGPDAAAAKHT